MNYQKYLDIYQDIFDNKRWIASINYLFWSKRCRMNEKVIISYAKLWKTMIDRGINKTQLKEKTHISTNAVAKMGKNESVSLDTIAKVCVALECPIEDVIEINIKSE